jgi:hypothetical protein
MNYRCYQITLLRNFPTQIGAVQSILFKILVLGTNEMVLYTFPDKE